MNDVFGNALQKLAAAATLRTTEAVSQAHQNEPGPGDSAASGDRESNVLLTHSENEILPIECRVSDAVLTQEPESSETESDTGIDAESDSPGLTDLPEAAPKRTLKAIVLQDALPFLQAHRRRVAAAVVLFCMAVLWSEENTSTPQQTSVEPTVEMTSVESLLEDFATVDSRKMRDPAEPVNMPAPGFELTIPNSMDQTTLSSSPDSGSNTGVRFTGRIQPLK